jgi:predicted trehalose synthase
MTSWYSECVWRVVVAVALTAAFGAAVRVATARGSKMFRRRGWYVYAWAVGAAVVGGYLALGRATPDGVPYFHEVVAGYVGLAVLIGVALGNLHAVLAVPDYGESSQQDNYTPY